MTVMKHFAFNEQETNRFGENSIIDEQTAWELYYPPFEACIDAGATSAMCSYNKVNGTWACENQDLLDRDLRQKLGFRGYVMSDWGATHTTSLAKGLDMDQPGAVDTWFSQQRVSAAGAGAVDQAAHRILASNFRLRLSEYPNCDPPGCGREMHRDVRNPEHRAVAGDVAAAAVVLLKNIDVLPLVGVPRERGVRRIAVVGQAASAEPSVWGQQVPGQQGLPAGDYYSGGGSGHIHANPDNVITALDGITRRARDANIEVVASASSDPSAAVELARQVDVVIVVAGATAMENQDRASLHLDDGADELIEAVAEVKPTVVLMQTPGAVLTPWRDKVAACLALFMGGQATGQAWGAVLFGDVSPGGRLPIEMPASEYDVISPSDKAAQTTTPSPDGWACHNYDAGRGEGTEWCKTVGTRDGVEYSYTEGGGECGKCWCCKRSRATLQFVAAQKRRQPPREADVSIRKLAEAADVAGVVGLYDADVHYKERVFTSYREWGARPAFAFGHGLTYSTFDYRAASAFLGGDKAGNDDPRGRRGLGALAHLDCAQAYACARVTVVNTGSWAAREVAQAYVEFRKAPNQPRLQLRGFHKTRVLKPGEEEVVTFPFSRRDMSVHSSGPDGPWVLQRAARVHIGASSADVRHLLDIDRHLRSI
uniref:Probable beta-glucosidase G n=1 Tax=Zooxanthella nutricula TaxID=1333877 RepID=A0A7S2Q2D7_9DINO